MHAVFHHYHVFLICTLNFSSCLKKNTADKISEQLGTGHWKFFRLQILFTWAKLYKAFIKVILFSLPSKFTSMVQTPSNLHSSSSFSILPSSFFILPSQPFFLISSMPKGQNNSQILPNNYEPISEIFCVI